MEERDLLHQIEQLLEIAEAPLLAREITEQLGQRGIHVDRTAVSSSLYRQTQQLLVKDERHRWSALSTQALHVVDAAAAPLSAKEIARRLNQRGFHVNRAQVNKSLYRTTQTILVKGDDHRWRRGLDGVSIHRERAAGVTELRATERAETLRASSHRAADPHATPVGARTAISAGLVVALVLAVVAWALAR